MEAFNLSPSPDHLCKVYRLDCHNESDRWLLAFLQGIATSQSKNFVKVFPWETTCAKNSTMIHYVSLSIPSQEDQARPKVYPTLFLERMWNQVPTVCGWMTVLLERPQRAAYINTISTRNATDASYKRVGALLRDALMQDLKGSLGKHVDYVYLLPLDEPAAKVYERWGFKYLHEDVKYMFFPLKKGPSPKVLESMMVREDASDAEDDLLATIRERLPDAKLQRLFDQKLHKDDTYRYTVMELYHYHGSKETPDDDAGIRYVIESLQPDDVSKKNHNRSKSGSTSKERPKRQKVSRKSSKAP